MISRANLILAVCLAEAPSQRHSNQWESFRSMFETPPALFRATHKCQMVHMYHFITYFFNYFVLNITLPFLSSTISRIMGLTHCHQISEPVSSSVPCIARLSDTVEDPSTHQTIVIQYGAGSLIMPLRPINVTHSFLRLLCHSQCPQLSITAICPSHMK